MTENQVLRAVKCGEIITRTKCTLREAAAQVGIGKSTVHKDVVVRLPFIDRDMAEEVARILNFNLQDRHIRGGKSTKQKYAKRSKI